MNYFEQRPIFFNLPCRVPPKILIGYVSFLSCCVRKSIVLCTEIYNWIYFLQFSNDFSRLSVTLTLFSAKFIILPLKLFKSTSKMNETEEQMCLENIEEYLMDHDKIVSLICFHPFYSIFFPENCIRFSCQSPDLYSDS